MAEINWPDLVGAVGGLVGAIAGIAGLIWAKQSAGVATEALRLQREETNQAKAADIVALGYDVLTDALYLRNQGRALATKVVCELNVFGQQMDAKSESLMSGETVRITEFWGAFGPRSEDWSGEGYIAAKITWNDNRDWPGSRGWHLVDQAKGDPRGL